MLYPAVLILATSAYLIFWIFVFVALGKRLSQEIEVVCSLSGESKHRLLYYDTVSDFYLGQILITSFLEKKFLMDNGHVKRNLFGSL